jgi:hypothetical protein
MFSIALALILTGQVPTPSGTMPLGTGYSGYYVAPNGALIPNDLAPGTMLSPQIGMPGGFGMGRGMMMRGGFRRGVGARRGMHVARPRAFGVRRR